MGSAGRPSIARTIIAIAIPAGIIAPLGTTLENDYAVLSRFANLATLYFAPSQ
jgi:hypothetical protein